MENKIIDVCGLSCPEPVIRVRKTLKNYDGEFKVISDQEVANENILRLSRKMGYECEIQKNDNKYELLIKKG